MILQRLTFIPAALAALAGPSAAHPNGNHDLGLMDGLAHVFASADHLALVFAGFAALVLSLRAIGRRRGKGGPSHG